MTEPLISLEKVWAEIRSRYDIAFLDGLMALPGARVMLFGGMVRDLLLNKEWKDLDIRVLYPTDKKDDVKKILETHGTVLQEVTFPTFAVYMANMPGSNAIVTDVAVVNSLTDPLSDFRVSALFFDVGSGELIEQVPDSLADLQNKIVHPVRNPSDALVAEPHLIFRAKKLAAATGFDIHPDFAAAIESHKQVAVATYLTELLAYIKDNGKNAWAEHNLNILFGGLTHGERYIERLRRAGILDEMAAVLGVHVPSPLTAQRPVEVDASRLNGTIEQNISVFLSAIARAISSDPEAAFNELKHLFALDSDRSDGKEFPTISNDISYGT